MDELARVERTWRVRVRVADDPGQLASLAAGLSDRGCNVLGMTVLPVGGQQFADASAAGDVVDELMLRAPVALGPDELSSVVAEQGARCVGIVAASLTDLVDGQTAVLRAAAGVLSGTATVSEALRLVLGADSVRSTASRVSPTADEDHGVWVDPGGYRVTITVSARERVVAAREWAPFTAGELARVPALLALLAAADHRSAAVAPTSAPGEPAGMAVPKPTTRGAARRQLSSLDVQFLNAETATTLTHVGALTLLDPSAVPGGAITVEEMRA
ncbi:MAG: hypothetical protein M3Y49_13965, partial [Actinomycetota bacterium]|nr:hypothetical protein [Actinomycetota bacterium]